MTAGRRTRPTPFDLGFACGRLRRDGVWRETGDGAASGVTGIPDGAALVGWLFCAGPGTPGRAGGRTARMVGLDEQGEVMSDDVLSIIPTDPQWQPDRAAAERAAALAADLAPSRAGGVEVEIDVTWHDTVTVVDCGGNLERIGCPHCGATIDPEWWADQLGNRYENGFANLAVEVPCCGVATSLDVLEHHWPCGFARFEIAIRNPARDWFSDEEPATIADALRHPVTQVAAHIRPKSRKGPNLGRSDGATPQFRHCADRAGRCSRPRRYRGQCP
jgi:hypothetical protein